MKGIIAAVVALTASAAFAAPKLYTIEGTLEDGFTVSPYVEEGGVVDEKPPVDSGEGGETPPAGNQQLAEVTYCQNFDTSQGLTFEYVEWKRRCDANEDGEYKFCEDWEYTGPVSFQSIWWNRGCLDDEDFSPVR